MGWFLTIAFLFFLYRLAKRARDRVAESAPTGILHSPLFHARTALLLALLGLTFAPAYLPHARWITVTYFMALAIVVTALLLVRRSLKWRYPI
jgi:hypothetical protein